MVFVHIFSLLVASPLVSYEITRVCQDAETCPQNYCQPYYEIIDCNEKVIAEYPADQRTREQPRRQGPRCYTSDEMCYEDMLPDLPDSMDAVECRSVLPEFDFQYARRCGYCGVWFPEGPPIFRPFIADPRQICYSVGWRFNDNVLGKNIIDVSLGDIIPIYRWCNIWFAGGDLELDIEAAIWAFFDPLHDASPLIDADYFIGLSTTYSFDNWAFRLRGYHISTHIGDEFLLNNRHFHRKNPSIEVLDFYFSKQLTRDIRLYGGVGWLCCQDDSFRCGSWYVEAGTELRLFDMGYIDPCNRLYGVPFLAMDFRYQEECKNHINATYAIGYEWGKLSVQCRRFRIYLEYHDGYAVEGQFCKFPTNYFSIRTSYGF